MQNTQPPANGKVVFTAIPVGIKDDSLRIAIMVSPKLQNGSSLGVFANWPDTAKDLRFNVRLGKIRLARSSGAPGYVDPAQTRSIRLGSTAYDTGLLDQGLLLYETLFAGASVQGFSLPTVKALKVYDSAGVRSCLQNIRREFYALGVVTAPGRLEQRFLAARQEIFTSQNAALTPPAAPASTSLASEAWAMVNDHTPAQPSAPAAAAAVAPFSALSSQARATALRDARRVWKDLDALKDEARDDIMKSVRRQSDPVGFKALPEAERKLHNPLIALRTFWQRRHRTGNTINSNLAHDVRGAGDNASDAEDYYRTSHDFHKRWSLVGYQSSLFPMLGIRLEIQMPRPADLANFSAISLEVVNPNLLPGLTVECPWTAYDVSFWPAPLETGAFTGGFFNVADPSYHVETEDLDHGGQATLQSMENLSAKYPDADALLNALEQGNDVFPPAPKTLGLSLIRQMRDVDVRRAIDRAALATNGPDQANWVWFAEDLVRGYIADVLASDPDGKAPARWFSLCKRKERVLLKKNAILDSPDSEGSLKPPVVSENEKTGGGLDEAYVSESMLSWPGVHLCAPSSKHGSAKVPSQGETPIPVTLWPDLTIEITEPEGPQAPLRFMAEYFMDLRGEFLTGDRPAMPSQVSPLPVPVAGQPGSPGKALIFRRLEPLGIPAVLLRLGTGSEDGDHRSVRNVILGKNDDSVRILAPPRISKNIVEFHFGKTRSSDIADGFQALKLKNADGSLPVVVDRFDSPAKIPYLPDPLAAEAILMIHDHISNEVVGPVTVPFYRDLSHDWPDALLHVLEFVKSDAAKFEIEPPTRLALTFPGVTSDSRAVRIKIPPGFHGTLRISSGFGAQGKDRLGVMEMWDRMQSTDRAAEVILQRGHPLLTPELTVDLKHAVKRPISGAVPKLPLSSAYTTTRKPAKFVFERDRGANLYTKDLEFGIDRKSTAKLHVTVDSVLPAKGLPKRKTELHLVAADQEIKTDEEMHYQRPDSDTVPLRVDPRRADYFRIQINTRAFSRFSTELEVKPEDSFLESGSEPIDLINVAPPTMPVVEYMMPTFGWEIAGEHASRFWVRRHGAGLRIYLTDDWDGEDLLGIALFQNDALKAVLQSTADRRAVPISIPMEAVANEYASAWGLDPKYAEESMAGPPLRLINWDFPFGGSPTAGTEELGACGWDLPLQEYQGNGSDVKVAVVGYRPQFDGALNKWFAEIVFDRAPRYGTFVRFAFVRYQPLSKKSCELSRVAMSDFAKLSVDRTLTIQRIESRVTGVGKDHTEHRLAISIWGIPNPRSANTFEVTLERKHFSKTRTLAWKADAREPAGSSFAPPDFKPEVPEPKEQLLWYQELSRDECVDKMLVIREFEQITKALNDGHPGRVLFYADACEL